MHSRADVSRLRTRLEQAARALALVLIVLLLYEVLRPDGAPGARRASDGTVAATLRAAVLDGDDRPLELHFTRIPDPSVRDWAAALRRAGVPVRWHGERLAAAAISVEPIPDPRGGYEVRLWQDRASPAVLRDDAGELARIQDSGVTIVTAPSMNGSVQAELPGQRLRIGVADSLQLRAVLVLARAGWEARFLLRTLEELGWSTQARLAVAPGVFVLQGTQAALDTSRHAAVIVLDTTAASQATVISRFVRSGGGLILAGEGSAAGAFGALSPGSAARRVVPTRELLPEESPQDGLTRWTFGRLHAEAATLGAQREAASITARRVAAGRVAQAAYEDSWRLRMEGGDRSPELHHELWARLLSAVAYAPAPPVTQSSMWGEHAPYAAMLDALGAPGGLSEAHFARARLPLLPMFVAALVLLLCEWFSRRLRGAA